jgi:hypothetical protein
VFERFSFQAFEKNYFQGQNTELLKLEGFYDLDFNATSYVWLPNRGEEQCCVTFCASKKKSTGYWCDPRKRNATDNDTGFRRVSLWCGRWNKKTHDEMFDKCS